MDVLRILINKEIFLFLFGCVSTVLLTIYSNINLLSYIESPFSNKSLYRTTWFSLVKIIEKNILCLCNVVFINVIRLYSLYNRACHITALFGVILETNKHQNLMRLRHAIATHLTPIILTLCVPCTCS